MNSTRQKIAVVGSGISGLSAAWALKDKADVTVFEADNRFGGHAKTVTVDYDGSHIDVDVGFIVCNPLNYPNFMQFMDALGVETMQSDMSFSVSDPAAFEWSSNPNGIFAHKRNLFRPSFLRLLRDIFRFNAKAREAAGDDALPSNMTLAEYLDDIGMSEDFRANYIYPMGAAIWSTPEAKMMDYPARSFLRFFNNHRLLHTERPQWRTVKGGSQAYVSQLVSQLGSRARMNAAVTRVDRTTDGVRISVNGEAEDFDQVILACHVHQVQDILGDGFEYQASSLARSRVNENVAYLHRDAALMPKRKRAWAAWNVLKGETKKITLSYWMNILQNIDEDKPLFVTLNPETPPQSDLTFGRFEFTHPMFDLPAAEAVEAMETYNGRDGLWFAGAWLGHGFHEDGLKSGLRVALALGAELPWEPAGIAPITRAPMISEAQSASVAAQ
ncbi:FAD-dependent oxidoreductase [Ponticaulis sp.]|uniref:NAD(P)/FAD-dependent oxidoreductase n=1 Tax=Ponticaulis sp. TaxID=2020902 RepID=UPI0026262936|nr:FAD-dependent oxidoreductase [Ponticaulis sp.]MDF1681462.1 FAD-dependent oxidoreductase [Ponticaulis sp.]